MTTELCKWAVHVKRSPIHDSYPLCETMEPAFLSEIIRILARANSDGPTAIIIERHVVEYCSDDEGAKGSGSGSQ